MSEQKKEFSAALKLAALVLGFCVLTGLAFFALVPHHPYGGHGWRPECINNLRQIDGAKQQWMLEHRKNPEDVPSSEDVAAYLKNNKFPKCPAGGTYIIRRLDQEPTCSIPDHKLPPP